MKTHGLTRTDSDLRYLYGIWTGMMNRCYKAKKGSRSFESYRGRGIRVCRRWHNVGQFAEDILKLLGHRPDDSYSLDRYPDNNGHYEPGNVRWATAKQQALNTRANKHITAFNETKTQSMWACELGVSDSRVADFLKKGHSMEWIILWACDRKEAAVLGRSDILLGEVEEFDFNNGSADANCFVRQHQYRGESKL